MLSDIRPTRSGFNHRNQHDKANSEICGLKQSYDHLKLHADYLATELAQEKVRLHRACKELAQYKSKYRNRETLLNYLMNSKDYQGDHTLDLTEKTITVIGGTGVQLQTLSYYVSMLGGTLRFVSEKRSKSEITGHRSKVLGASNLERLISGADLVLFIESALVRIDLSATVLDCRKRNIRFMFLSGAQISEFSNKLHIVFGKKKSAS